MKNKKWALPLSHPMMKIQDRKLKKKKNEKKIGKHDILQEMKKAQERVNELTVRCELQQPSASRKVFSKELKKKEKKKNSQNLKEDAGVIDCVDWDLAELEDAKNKFKELQDEYYGNDNSQKGKGKSSSN